MNVAIPIINVLVALVAAPLLIGTINRVKSVFGGRNGPPLLQPYFDIVKLLRKGAVYSKTTTWVLKIAPSITLASILCALALTPLGRAGSPISFAGDVVALVALLAISRFATILGALDTGSAFEGMGASREAQFSVLAEPALLLGLAAPALLSGTLTLSEMYGASSSIVSTAAAPALILSATALFVALLVENSRIPVDDPNTHLELTMIHEVMILDYGGPDLGFIEYASALKLWIMCALVSGLLIPINFDNFALDVLLGVAGVFLAAIMVGVLESCMARLKLLRLPQLIIAASILALMAALLIGGR